ASIDLHGHRIAAAVAGTPGGDPDPALAHAVFLDIGAFLAIEADADAAAERGFVVVRAAGIVAEAVGWGLRHVGSVLSFRRDGVAVRGARGYPRTVPAAASGERLAFGGAAAQQVGQRLAVRNETQRDRIQAVAL